MPDGNFTIKPVTSFNIEKSVQKNKNKHFKITISKNISSPLFNRIMSIAL